ncbi:MAG: S8 family serine peptidase, partial [Bacteroidota bacterium]
MRKHYGVLVALLLLVCNNLKLSGQEGQPKNQLDDFYHQKNQFQNQKSGNEYYVNLQFEQIPDQAVLQQLAQEGIQLLSYQSDLTYHAILPSKIKRATLEHLGIRAVRKQPLTNKLSRAIRYENIPEHAKAEAGKVDLAIVFQKSVSKEQINLFCQQNQAIILQDRIRGGKTVVARVAVDRMLPIAQSPIVAFVDVRSEEVEKLTHECKVNQRVNTLQSGIAGARHLEGERVVIGVGDGGELGDHIDFDDRVINKASGTYSSFGDHGDHVAGIIGGAGHIDPRHRGIAPSSTIITQKTGSITFYAEDYFNEHGMVLTNNSYGTSFNCDLNGAYNYTSQNLDWQMLELPEVLHVFAAGNSGKKTCDPYPKGYRTVLRYYQSAKNILTVGNVDKNRNIYSNSSRGPVKDGRIKPEICGVGAKVISTGREYNYKTKSGTSMSSPAVVGSLALMYEHYRNLNGDLNPEGALMKAIACNTAEDLGNPGPDFIYGFGLMNAKRAVEVIENNQFQSDELSNNEEKTIEIEVPADMAQLKVMLYWHDKEAELESIKALVNDLDLTLTDPNGTDYLPWVLNIDPTAVDGPAERGVDTLNNIEQITIDFPTAGTYVLRVNGSAVPFGPQRYHLTYEFVQPEVELTYPYGKEKLQPGAYEYIQWEAAANNSRTFKLAFSSDNGSTWTTIADDIPAADRTFAWTVPDVFTEEGKIRVTQNGAGEEDQNVQNFSILPVISNFEITPRCEGILDFKWDKSSLTDIATYDLCYYDGQEMKSLVTTTDNAYSLEDHDFELGQTYWFSVRVKMNSGEYNQRVIAGSVIPQSNGLCPWENDVLLQTVYIKGTGRQMTSSHLTNDEIIQVSIMNVGTNPVTGVPITYLVNNNMVTETIDQIIEPGDSAVYVFDTGADMGAIGTYEIDAWIDFDEDAHKSNDSLVSIPEIIHLPNAPVDIQVGQPLLEDFSAAENKTYTSSTMGLGGLLSWDYELSNEASGQMELDATEKSLKLYPIIKELDENYENNLIWTINLANYEVSQGHLELSLRYLNDTIIALSGVPSDNKIFVRGNDQEEWLELYTMVVNEPEWQTVGNLSITNRLIAGGQTPSSSSQIKFSQSDEFGFLIDDLAITMSSSLPVNLIQFTAQKIGEHVLLKWDTASEINNDYFDIEVAIGEAAVGNNEFQVLGRINGRGTTNQLSHYQFMDKTPGKIGNRYYRLKQVDLDGVFNYSPIRLVNFDAIESEVMVYPNPFIDQLKIRYQSEEEKQMDIFLVDAQGRLIQQFNETVVIGVQDLLLEVPNRLANGVYYLKLGDMNQ